MTTKDELEPIDATQCQATWKGGSFMTFGPRSTVRCPCIPTWLAVDVKGGQFYGAMALCDKCKQVCEIKIPTARYQKLKVG